MNAARGKVTFSKKSDSKLLAVSSADKVTVKKGLKKKAYTVKVYVRAAGDTNYETVVKIVTFKVKVA